ncbi:MAG: SDR family NAD(P)-dependent oxidoreductase [Candidatus Puniceispirillum sp.]|jgi:NAD(P)-dependent dehydrogenase (short-subunit alcohol dehydrogenase family)
MHIIIQGAGRGIGLALAHQANAAGATKLYLVARNPANSDGYQQLPPSDKVKWFTADFTKPDTISACGAEICAKAPHIDRLISTAGLLHDAAIQPEKAIHTLSPQAMMTVYQVNAMGPALFVQALWPQLRSSPGVKIAALSARVGSIGDNRLGGWYSYRASKAALNQYIRSISIELARYNPQSCVVSLHPGTVDTALSKPFQSKVDASQLQTPQETARRLWTVLDHLGGQDSGGFFAYDGTPIRF